LIHLIFPEDQPRIVWIPVNLIRVKLF